MIKNTSSSPVFGQIHPDMGNKLCFGKLAPLLGQILAYHPAPESPRPWANIKVAVCFLAAGTMYGFMLVIVEACRRYLDRIV